MGLRNFARSLMPGNDRQLAADLTAAASRQRRQSHRNGGSQRAARQGQAWEDEDRAQDRKGGWYRAR